MPLAADGFCCLRPVVSTACGGFGQDRFVLPITEQVVLQALVWTQMRASPRGHALVETTWLYRRNAAALKQQGMVDSVPCIAPSS